MTQAFYRAIDHVMIRLLEIEPLFSLFSNVFGLPVSWPKESSSFATFGWVNVGNTDLEFWAAANNADLPSDCQPPLIHGFALDPVDLSSSVSQLAELGIACKAPRPYETLNEQGVKVTNFTNSVVLGVSSPECSIFFCAWDKNASIFPWKEKLTAVERRARDREVFRRCAGGALGLVGLRKIELAVEDVGEASEKWRALTGSGSQPIALTDGVDGTDLELVAGKRHMIQSLTFDVRSLAVAKDFLAARDLLESFTAEELVMSSAATGGIQFKIVQGG
jgi:hypothetical protein